MERLAQRGVLKLTPDRIFLICAGGTNTAGGPQVWAQINVPSVFSEYRTESNTNNEIYLEFVPSSLSKALKSTTGATAITVKLAKRLTDGHPVLSFTISGQSRSGNALSIVQEVTVRVLKQVELEDVAKEPMCPEPDVHILLPQPLDMMRGVVERMKSLDPIIRLSINRRGVLKLRTQSDLANVETEWRGLTHPESNNNTQRDNADDEDFHSVSMESKHMLRLLTALSSGSHTICCK